MKKIILFQMMFIVLFIGKKHHLYAQPYVKKMNIESPNFYEIQSEFNKYWEDKTPTKSSGYKQFRRWEYFMKNRVKENGEFVNAGKTYWDIISQQKSAETNKKKAGCISANWTELGPRIVLDDYKDQIGYGRINDIEFDSNGTMYVCAPDGGIWKFTGTENNPNWEPIADLILPNVGVSDLVIHPNNPNIMYVATGDAVGLGSSFVAARPFSMGILKSVDGGSNWTPCKGLGFDYSKGIKVRKLKMHPINSQKLYAVTSNGFYKTSDGFNWVKENPTVDIHNFNFSDIEFNQQNPDQMYVSTYHGEILIRSEMEEETVWELVLDANENPKFENDIAERVELAIAPSNPNIIYAVVATEGGELEYLYKSNDGGNNFTPIHGNNSDDTNILENCLGNSDPTNNDDPDNQGQSMYCLAIEVHPNDSDILYVGGVNLWKSVNGGTEWSLSAVGTSDNCASPTTPYVHVDYHHIAFNGSNYST